MVADIASVNGSQVTAQAMDGVCNEERSHYYRWPTQPRPPKPEWNLWKYTLSRGLTSFNLQLQMPLGQWTDTTTLWRWFYSPHKDWLYKHIESKWQYWIQVRTQ